MGASSSSEIVNNLVGEQLFRYNCATCHNPVKDMAGPALENIEKRVPDKKLLYAWIRNNTAVLKSGNSYFNGLYNKWNKTPMNIFPDLQSAEIDSILAYVNEYARVSSLP